MRLVCGGEVEAFETFEHKADMGIRGRGKTVEEAFINGAKALFSVMIDIENVDVIEEYQVRCSADDMETLFVEWLNSLISLSDSEGVVFSQFELKLRGNILEGKAFGETLDRERHRAVVEVKAATYHMLKVEEREGEFVAQCVVDV
jgi:SHS2 domain-containing protein